MEVPHPLGQPLRLLPCFSSTPVGAQVPPRYLVDPCLLSPSLPDRAGLSCRTSLPCPLMIHCCRLVSMVRTTHTSCVACGPLLAAIVSAPLCGVSHSPHPPHLARRMPVECLTLHQRAAVVRPLLSLPRVLIISCPCHVCRFVGEGLPFVPAGRLSCQPSLVNTFSILHCSHPCLY